MTIPDFDDNPAWTLDDMKQAIPAKDFFNTENFKALQTRSRTMRGKQKAPTKIAVHVRLDPRDCRFFQSHRQRLANTP